MQNLAYGYDLLGKLLNRSDANTNLAESFTYDTLNRLTSSTVSLNPTPLVSTFTFNAIGNLISKSDVGTYSYPAPGQPRPHGVTSISGGVINTTFSYDAKGNMTSGNDLTIGYTAFDKPATITRGTTAISFDHDPEHQRYAQTGASGITLYIAGGGVLAERFAGSGGTVQWSNYLIAGGRLVGVHIERSDETTATRYFHTDHLGSISVITDENAVVLERLSYDAWGQRRHADGTPDPAGSITSEASSIWPATSALRDQSCEGAGFGHGVLKNTDTGCRGPIVGAGSDIGGDILPVTASYPTRCGASRFRVSSNAALKRQISQNPVGVLAA